MEINKDIINVNINEREMKIERNTKIFTEISKTLINQYRKELDKKFNNKTINIIIGAGGLKYDYASGCAMMLYELKKQGFINIDITSGASSGAGVAIGLKSNLHPKEFFKIKENALINYKNNMSLAESYGKIFNNILSENICDIIKDKVYITTHEYVFPFSIIKHVYNNFHNKTDLTNILSASASIPFLTIKYLFYKYNNKNYIDGYYPYTGFKTTNPSLYINLFKLKTSNNSLKYINKYHSHKLILRGLFDMFYFLVKDEPLHTIYWYKKGYSNKYSKLKKIFGLIIFVFFIKKLFIKNNMKSS